MTKNENVNQNDEDSQSIKLLKIISEAGIASRRKCEKYIESGRVRVNNQVITDPAFRVLEKDEVSFDRQIIEREDKHYIVLYKPQGVVSTTKYLPGGRRIITDFFKDIKERLFYAGRLDSESRGIMIITNDGAFANIITHPSYEIMKTYDVAIRGKLDSEKILKASNGIVINNVKYSPFKFKILSKGFMHSKVRITINEGKNREIRKIFEFLGYKVIDLERISVGIVSKTHKDLGTLEAGQTRRLTESEINFFFSQKDNASKKDYEKIDLNEKNDKEYHNHKAEPTKVKSQDKSKWAKAKPKPNKHFKKIKIKAENKNKRNSRPKEFYILKYKVNIS